ncbi:MAG TPA: DMT family transporter [Dehalococcoidia bacterium]|jgi:transporter family protein|nr:DMT family transporter [Dehalococcoidia bacterium]
MNYLPLAFITMVGLGVHYFLAKLISPHISSPAIAILGTVVYFPLLIGYIYFTKTPIIPEQKIYIVYAILIGIPMAIAVLSLYIAIAKGPVSVVMPIYALNAMVTVILGIIVLHEPVSVPKVVGLVLAVAAIILLSR